MAAAKKKTATKTTVARKTPRPSALHPILTEARAADSMMNLLTGMGTDRDPRRYTQTVRSPAKTIADLDTGFVEGDLEHNIVAIPAEDMTREWIDLQGKGETPEKIELELDRIGARTAMFEALMWSRLVGSAIVVVGLDNQKKAVDPRTKQTIDEPDLALPAQPGKVQWLQVYDRYEVGDVELADDGSVEIYVLNVDDEEVRVHASRVLRFDADPMPRRQRTDARWGLSVLERCKEPIQNLDTAMAGVAIGASRFSETVLKMNELKQLLAQDKGGAAKTRIGMMNAMRSMFGIMLVDKNDDLEELARSFAGVPDVLDRLIERVASAARMPVSLLMGRSPAGLNATGEAEIRHWYSHIAALQQTKLRPALWRLIQLIAVGIGVDADADKLALIFSPLWKPTEKEKAETHLTQAQADNIYLEAGVLEPEEVRASRFAATGYSTETLVELADKLDDALNDDDVDPDALDEDGNPKPKPEPTDPTKPAPAPVPGAPGGDIQKTALNGAQVTAAQAIVLSVSKKELPRDTGVAMLQAFFNLSKDDADAVMGEVGKTFFAASPPAPAPAPAPDPAEDDPAAPKPPKGKLPVPPAG